jgi:2-keto-3-deoxy-L-rhamnonate aldolase RhmA
MTSGRGLRLRLARGDRLHGVMAFELFTPGLTQIIAGVGYDFVILDMEHSGVGIETIKAQIAFARGLEIGVWVRVPERSYAAVAGVLDAGATGIMLPLTETAEDASALVEWARYRPEGRRGLGFGIAHDDYRSRDPRATMTAANDAVVLIALIESRRGIANAEAILATPGIDLGWLGHFDLSADLGIPGGFDDPSFERLLDDLCRAAAAATKPLAIMHGEAGLLERCAARGFTVFGQGSDVAAFKAGLTSGLAMLRDLPTGSLEATSRASLSD